MKRFFRWLWNKNELEAIHHELHLLRILLLSEIERQQPKRHQPVQPIGRIQNR